MKIQNPSAGLAAALVIAVIGIAPPASAQQCPKQVGNSWTDRRGQEPYSVMVAGSYAYLWDAHYMLFTPAGPPGWRGGNLNVIDVSDPEGPRIVANWKVGSFALDASGRLRFELHEGLTITDVSDPANPVVLSTSFEDELMPSPITVSGDYAYIPNLEGLTVLNIGDPANPLEIGRLSIDWLPTGIRVEGESAFVWVQGGSLRIIDVSDPEHPREAGSWQTTLDVRGFAVSGGFVYVAYGTDGLRVIDVTDPAAPVELAVLSTVEEAWDVSVSGPLATIALGSFGVGVFDVSNPRQPEMLAVYSTDGPVWDVALSGDTAYVAVGSDGKLVPPWTHGSAPPYGAEYGEFGGFRVVDLSSPEWPTELASFSFVRTALDVAVKDGLEYYALGHAGIAVGPPPDYPFSFPEELDTPGLAVGITPYDHYALVADLHKGLRIVDVSDPSHMVEVGFVDTPGESYEVAVAGHHAYVADGGSGLRVIDISSPDSPVEVGAVDTPGSAIGVAVSGDFAYVADAEEGLRIIDVSAPARPTEVRAPGWIPDARAVAVADDLVLVVSRLVLNWELKQFRVLDVSDPTAPQSVGVKDLTFRGDPTDLALSGSFAYVTTSRASGIGVGGLEIIDISNLFELQRVGEWERSGDVSGLWLAGGRAYLAAGEQGIPILDTRCLTTYWVDIVAHQSGLNESEWRSDIIINNEHRRRDVFFKRASSDPYTVDFILHTADGVFTSEGAIVPEGQGVYEDIVGTLGYEGIGALEIRTEVPVSVSSRVYTDTGTGTFGARSPAYRSSDCLSFSDSGWLYGLRQVAGEYRTNISVTNTGTGAFWAKITLYRTDGRFLTEYQLKVDPGMVVQDLQPFKRWAGKPNVGWGFAKVEGKGFLASATVIDSRTNDSVVVPMVK